MEQTTRTHNLSKRLLSLLLAAVMILSLMMTNALITAFAYSGKDYTNNAELAAKLDNVFNGNVKLFSNTNATYPVGSREDINFKYSWAGYSGYQCYAYAQAVYYYLFGDVVYHGSSSYANSSVVIRNTTSLTYDSLNAAGVGCGAYVRTTNNSDGSYNGNYGHSMIILSYDKNNITILHGNADNNGLIKLESRSWNSFNTYLVNSSDRRVSHVVQPNLTKNSNYGNWFDDGTGFYAYIVKKDSWMSLQNMNGNVQLRDKADSYDPRQIWLFNRQSDGSYEIVNMYDNTCLDAASQGNTPGTNVGTYTKNNTVAQRWFLKLTSNDDVNIFPSYCNLALDVDGNYNDPGTNIKLWTYSDNTAQRYSIYKLDWDGTVYSKPAKPDSPSLRVKTLGTTKSPTVLQWTASPLKNNHFDNRLYDVRIFKDGNWPPCAQKLGTTDLSFTVQLEAGNYTAQAAAVNTKYASHWTYSDVISFTVPCAHNWNSGTVTTEPTYFSSGIKTYKCNNCGEKKTETIPSLEIPTSPTLVNNVSNNGHTYSLYVAKMTWDEAKAWCESNGGYLCTITSEEEQATVQSIIVNQSSSWLGAERGPDNQFRWITCEPWSYANWSEGEPNSTLENCVHIKDNYEWNDYGKTNSSPNGFIMETGDTPTAIHTWDSGKVTKEATCAVPGNKTFICAVCGTSRTETIEKTSVHTWDDGHITKEPTCAAAGNKTFTCSVCGTTRTETIEKTTDHTWDSGMVTEPVSGSKPGVLTFTCTTCGATKEEKYWDQIHYQVGDLIHFGSYPQNLITDNAIISALDGITKNWINYGYYSGIQSFDVFKDVDMKYADISYNGNKYRAVSFSEYRPYYTTYAKYPDVSLQDDNGYIIGNTYYFQFEPLMWRILDPEIGLIICDKIIDAQAFQDTHYYDLKTDGKPEVYQNENSSIYANNYAMCSLRTWLNSDFFNIAFSEQEKKLIQNTSLNNDAFAAGYSQYNAPTTEDKVFLLSWNDVQTESYGFEPSRYSEDTARIAQGTDYAKCQGLEVDDQVFKISNSDHEGTSFWWLRTPSIYSFLSCTVDGDGVLHGGNCDLLFTGGGVRPACRIINTKPETKCKDGHTWDAGIITESATCAASGEKTFTCTVCGTTKTETIVKTTSHKWDSGKVTKAATCAATGVKTFTCTICKTTKTEIIAKTTDHKWDSGKVTKAATCAATGVKTFTCSVCKATKTETLAKTKDHKWDAGVVTIAPTCTRHGVKTYTCTVCKTTKIMDMANTPHQYTSTGKCANCGAAMAGYIEPSLPDDVGGDGKVISGDVDGDGEVTSGDARLALRTSVRLEKNIVKGTDAYLAADADGDGEVTSGDARLILRSSVGLEDLRKFRENK